MSRKLKEDAFIFTGIMRDDEDPMDFYVIESMVMSKEELNARMRSLEQEVAACNEGRAEVIANVCSDETQQVVTFTTEEGLLYGIVVIRKVPNLTEEERNLLCGEIPFAMPIDGDDDGDDGEFEEAFEVSRFAPKK